MKTTLVLSLIALGACADTAPVESDNNYGYEAPAQENYSEESTYEPQAPQQVCVACAEATPCWTGVTCVALVGETTAYNYEDDKGNRFLAATATSDELVCPCGAVDTRFYQVNNTTVLWVTFGLLFLPGLWFFFEGLNSVRKQADQHSVASVGSGIVCLVASLAYLTMALGYGFTTKCNGRDFYFARYIDWIITTPIMMYHYVGFATDDQITKVFIVFMDIFMIAAGLIGELIEGPERWAFFGFGMFAFIPIIYVLCGLASKVGGCCGHRTVDIFSWANLFRKIVSLIIIVWFIYPIIFVLAQANVDTTSCGYSAAQTGYNTVAGAVVTRVGVISVQDEAIAYSVLDIIAKSIVGAMIVCHNYNPVAAAPAPASGSYL